MRINHVRLVWFRGAAEAVELTPQGKSLAVYGPNGSGKSSFIDAIEYVIGNGKVGHLSHEYSGRHQEKAIPNTHIPDGQKTEFWIGFADDTELHVKITANGNHAIAGAEAINMPGWNYQRTVLRQDEVADFIRSRKGDKYSALLPLFGLHELEVAAENLRQLARSVEQQSKLAQKQGALQATTAKRQAAFGNDTNEAIAAGIAELYKIYCAKFEIAEPLARCKELEIALVKRIADLTEEDQRYVALQTLANLDLTVSVKAVRDANAKLSGSVEPLIAEKLEVLQAAGSFTGKLTAEQKIDCPACGRLILAEDFKAHVKAEHDRLEEIIAVYEDRRTAIGKLIDDVKTVKSTLAKAQLEKWPDDLKAGALRSHIEWIDATNPEALRQALQEEDLQSIEKQCSPLVKTAAEASQTAPPDIKDLSAHAGLVEAARTVFEARELAAEISRIEGLIAFIAAAEGGIRDEIRARAETVIKDISDDISDMWKVLHPGAPIENVHLYMPEDDKAIDIALRFHGKDQNSPRLTLSEGYRNSLGLCIFLAMAKRESGSDRPLFLDDVVVSFDRNHRGMIVDLLAQQFSDRQVIVFTHDRDWFSDLRRQLDEKVWGFRILRTYETPLVGIRWADKSSTFDEARIYLNDRPDFAGNDARKIMDIELGVVAQRLKLRLPYLRGDNNDKRMWSEFLERVMVDGKDCLQKKTGKDFVRHTAGLERLDRAGRLLVSWGNRSSHSPDVVRPEAEKLIDACEQALDVFKCSDCSKQIWYADTGNSESVQCQCGEMRWRYGRG